jgi:hypothetical protein
LRLSEEQQHLARRSRLRGLRTLLPISATLIFVAMLGIAERQIRSSPNWPPPARHEVGGWEIENPAIWNWAAGLNLPATIVVMWVAAQSDAVTYAVDDHNLLVYVPWVVLVFLLWCFVAYRLDLRVGKKEWSSSRERYLVLVAQVLLTIESIFPLQLFHEHPPGTPGRTVGIICAWLWTILVVLGWADWFLRRGVVSAGQSLL